MFEEDNYIEQPRDDTTAVKFAKVYVRSLAAIATIGTVTMFGMYLGQTDANTQIVAIGAIVSCVLFDKPKVSQ